MKFLILLLFISNSTFALDGAGDRTGNGGSYSEVDIAAEQEILKQTIGKIVLFFLNNPSLEKEFTEFNKDQLINATRSLSVEVVDYEVFDKHGLKRTCINDLNLIRCDITELKKINHDPKITFVLMFHELLGLMSVEETSPANASMIDGYSTSKKIAPYVVKTNDYNLVITTKDNRKRIQFTYTHRVSHERFGKSAAKKLAEANAANFALEDCENQGYLKCKVESKPTKAECSVGRQYQQDPRGRSWFGRLFMTYTAYRSCFSKIEVSGYPTLEMQAEIDRQAEYKHRQEELKKRQLEGLAD